MIRPPDDLDLRRLFAKSDPVRAPDEEKLALLENRILSRLDEIPSSVFMAGDAGFPFRTLNLGPLLRGACLTAVLSVALGFLAGHQFSQLSKDPAAEAAMSPTQESWHDFIEGPELSGDSSDAAE